MIEVKPGDYVISCSEVGRAYMMRADSVGPKQVRQNQRVGYLQMDRSRVIFAGTEAKAEAVRSAIDHAGARLAAAKRSARDTLAVAVAPFEAIRDHAFDVAADEYKANVANIIEAAGNEG